MNNRACPNRFSISAPKSMCGRLAIHNPADTANEVDIRIAGDPNNSPDPAFLPNGILNSSPVETICFPILPFEARVLPHDLAGLGLVAGGSPGGSMQGMAMGAKPMNLESKKGKHAAETVPEIGPPALRERSNRKISCSNWMTS
jgi:hypothetical protein